MNIKGIEIRVERMESAEAHVSVVVVETAEGFVIEPAGRGKPALFRVSTAASTGAPDERSVRAACARCLSEADSLKLSSIALPALGCRPGGLSPVASAKIMAQEAIRLARSGGSALRSIRLRHPDGPAFAEFEKAATGYIRHFLDVLIWGPFVTVDAIIEVQRAQSVGIVLVKRSSPPFGYALPGGFVDYGESLEEAVRREAREETGMELLDLEQFHTYSNPLRDPRFHTVTTVFSARAEGTPRAGDDAADVLVAEPEEIRDLTLAFDHGDVLEDFLKRRGRAGKGRG